MKIANLDIGDGHRPKIIAEMSGNHNQSLELALKIADAAYHAGVHMLKLQTYTPETITLNVSKNEFVVNDPNSIWAGRSLHSLYEEAHTPWDWQKKIIDHSHDLGMPCFSSVFDETSVEFLEQLDIAAYKIASQEIIHLPLIKLVSETGKPIIISTGMATLSEIDEAVETVIKSGRSSYALLKCTSSYPTPPEYSNLATIPTLKKIFGCPVGLSDHTLGIGVPIAAIALGADLVEKHLTLDRNSGGVDSGFSSEPEEFKQLVAESLNAYSSIGSTSFGPNEADMKSLAGRRSIYVSRDIKAGDLLTKDNIKIVRPNLGLPPKLYPDLLGRKAAVDLRVGTALSWNNIL